jgi:hypothetical protein
VHSSDGVAAQAYILGGNVSTLAFVTSLRSDNNTVTAHLLPVAQTPLGTVLGDAWQNVTVALAGLLDWMDQNFPPEDEHAFVAPIRDIELLARINWDVAVPAALDESCVLNIEDVPDEIAHALLHPGRPLLQCSACRRLCVRDEFVWKDRPLCPWDYHRQVFGKRGPWHNGPYETRHFESVPQAGYVAPVLLEEGAEIVAALSGIDEAIAREAVNLILRADAERAYMTVRTPEGYTVLRER